MLKTPNSRLILAACLCCCTGCASLELADRGRIVNQPSAVAVETQIIRANDSVTSGCADGGCGELTCSNCNSQIEFGKPNRFIDGVGWFFGIPSKVLLWDRRAENHNVSYETASVVREYLRSNGMSDVKVRVNQYAPGDEWRRLTQNKAVSPLWRYSFGALSTVGYTLVPGRLFGRDNYNPFTNTVSIYSDISAMAVHEAAYARDNANHHYRGTYGFGQQIAGINIWHETQASKLAHRWMQDTQSPEMVTESNRILPPLYGIRVGGSIGDMIPAGDGLFTLAGAVTGHIVGHRMNKAQDIKTAETQTVRVIRPVSYVIEQ